MNRTQVHAFAALTVLALLSSAAAAQEGYGTVTFTVQVTGFHNVPTTEGGFRRVEKNRTFSGKARLKYAGSGFAQPSMKGFDKASFEREKDACEQKSSDEEDIAACQDEVQERQNAAERTAMSGNNPILAALNGPRTDVWVNDGCSGELAVADKGTYRGISVAEGSTAMREVPYSLSVKRQVTEDAPGADGCSFNLVYDPQAQTAEINVDPGPLRIEAVERTGESSTRTHLNPFDWSAVRKFEKGNIKVAGSKTGHSGAWNESMGEPMALSGAARVRGEVVQTGMRITWHFTGQPSPSKPVKRRNRDNAPVEGVPGGADDDPMPGCLKEQEEAGRAQPDPTKLLECLQKKSRGARG